MKKPTKKKDPKKTSPRKVGRPTSYKPEYCEYVISHFDVPAITIDDDGREKAADLPLIQDLAKKLGVCVDTINEWSHKHPEFSDAIKKGKEFQERNWIHCSLKGLYSTAFTIFFGKNVFKWTDKQDIDLNANVKVESNLSDDDRSALREAAAALSRKIKE